MGGKWTLMTLRCLLIKILLNDVKKWGMMINDDSSYNIIFIFCV